MWERLKEWRLRRTAAGVQDDGAPLDDYVAGYEDEGGENITAIIAGKLAMLSFADSALTVEDRSCPDAPGARVRLIRDLLTELWRCDAGWITAQMLGKGGKLLLPSYDGGSLHIRAIDQSRMAIRRMDGNRIASATLLADVDQLRDRECFLLADYELSGGDQRIRYRAVRSDGVALPLDCVERWGGITPEIGIMGTDRLLMAYLRCPRDNRRERRLYGVPITYGAERAIEELEEHGRVYRREYKLTRPMLGLDSSLWRGTASVQAGGGAEIERLRRTVQDSDDPFVPFDSMSLEGKGIWQYSDAHNPPTTGDSVAVLNATIADMLGGIVGSTDAVGTTFSNGANWYFTLVISNGHETSSAMTSIPRAFANVHLSGQRTGGVAFGKFSAATADNPIFECMYPAYFYGGIAQIGSGEANPLFAVPGETVVVSSNAILPGFASSGKKDIYISVPMGKLLTNVTGVQVESIVGWVRNDGGYGLTSGYIESGNDYTSLVTRASIDQATNSIMILIHRSTTFYVTNNQAITFVPEELRLAFE